MTRPAMTRPTMTPPAQCVVCNAPVSTDGAQPSAVCRRPSCQWTYRSTPVGERCAVCQRPLAAQERARGACARRECEEEWLVRRPARQRDARRNALTAHATAFRNASAHECGVPDAEGFVPTPVPHNSLPTAPLPPARREALRVHLTHTAAAALAATPSESGHHAPVQRAPVPVSSPGMAHVLQAACGACRGRCCVQGGEHAYITRETMRVYFDEHPGSTLEQAITDYMAPIPAETIEGGCVYQGETGCTLPTAMRADMCNTFFCESLVELQARHGADEPVRAFFAPEETGFFVNGVFAEPGLVRIVRRRAPAA
jgi:hypothetical protein